MIGLNFYAPSPRFVSLDAARQVRAAVSSRVRVVGVFVNAPRSYIEERVRELRLDLIQFSGDEDSAAIAGWNLPVIKALRIGHDAHDFGLRNLDCDYAMLDAFDANLYGGTGRRIASDFMRGLDLSRTFVAGGLTPDNVAEVAVLRPYAVDVASGVESAPGIKDHAKLRSFILNAKSPR